jgi:hypothetical protein
VQDNEIELKACLPCNIIKEYLDYLVYCGLLEYILVERAYKTTPKVVQVLITYHIMEEMLVKSH